MENREFDIVVFGATGYTGKLILSELLFQKNKYDFNFNIAMAGRSTEKMNAIKSEIITKHPQSRVGVIEADVFNLESLEMMCSKTKVLINCVGPFRLYGENVIRTCISTKTHYVDITGEPQFMEIMETKYNELAKENNLSVVMSCGFDSFPADMGAGFLIKTIKRVPDKISIIHDMSWQRIHSTTWRTALMSIELSNELKSVRMNRDIPKRKHYNNPWILYNPTLHKYTTKFIGSDHSVVVRTQNYFKHEYDVSVYQTQKGIFSLFLMLCFAAVVYIMTRTSFTLNLLNKYPEFFTFNLVKEEGATPEELKKGYTKTYYIGEYDDKQIIVKLEGPEPGYILTSLTAAYSAITILRNPKVNRGVLTPYSAFHSTNIFQLLEKEGVTFKVVYKGEKSIIPAKLE